MQRAAPVISEGQLERAAAFDERIITENERLKRDNGELHAKLKRANERVREADLRLERMGNALTAVIRAFYEFGKPSDIG